MSFKTGNERVSEWGRVTYMKMKGE